MSKVLVSLVILFASVSWASGRRADRPSGPCGVPLDRAFYQLMLSSQIEPDSKELFEFQLGLLNIINEDKSENGTEYLGKLSRVKVSRDLERFRDEVITKRGPSIIKWLNIDSCKESVFNLCQRFWSADCESKIKCSDYSANNTRLIKIIKKGEVTDSLLEGLRDPSQEQRCAVFRKLKKTGRLSATQL